MTPDPGSARQRWHSTRKGITTGAFFAVVLVLGVLLRPLWSGALALALLLTSAWLVLTGVRLRRSENRKREGLLVFLLAAGLLGYLLLVLVELTDDGGRPEQALGTVTEVRRFSHPPTSIEQAASGRSTKMGTARIIIPGHDFWHESEGLREGEEVLVTYRRGLWTDSVYVESVQKHYPGAEVQRH